MGSQEYHGVFQGCGQTSHSVNYAQRKPDIWEFQSQERLTVYIGNSILRPLNASVLHCLTTPACIKASQNHCIVHSNKVDSALLRRVSEIATQLCCYYHWETRGLHTFSTTFCLSLSMGTGALRAKIIEGQVPREEDKNNNHQFISSDYRLSLKGHSNAIFRCQDPPFPKKQ